MKLEHIKSSSSNNGSVITITGPPSPVDLFQFDPSEYPLVNACIPNLHLLSSAELEWLLDKHTCTRHFESGPMKIGLYRDYPRIFFNSNEPDHFPNYNGLMVLELEGEENNVYDTCNNALTSGSTLVGAVPFSSVCTITKYIDRAIVSFKPKQVSTVRNWMDQALKFANISHIILFLRTGALDQNGQLKRSVYEVARGVAASQSGRHTFILADDLSSVTVEYPHLIRSKLLAASQIVGNGKTLKSIQKETQRRLFGNNLIHDNIVVGNQWTALNALKQSSVISSSNISSNISSSSDNGVFDVIIECMAMGQITLDYCANNEDDDDSVELFEISSEQMQVPNKLDMLLAAHQSSRGRKLLLRVKDCPASNEMRIDAICSVGKFAAHLAIKESKRVLIFDQRGFQMCQFYAFATFVQCQLSTGRYLAADNRSLAKIIHEFSLIRPFTPFPVIRVIYETLVNGGEYVRYDLIPPPPQLPAEIIPGLYLGSVDESKNPDVLQMLNIRSIIGLVQTDYNGYGDDPSTDIKLLRIESVEDNASVSLKPHFDKCLQCIDAALQSGHGVLVHCQAGVSRSATLVMAYLMWKKRMCLRQAFCHVRASRIRFVVQPNEQFMYDLLELELELFGRRSVNWFDLCQELHALNLPFANKGLIS